VAIAAISLIGNAYLGYYMLFGLASDGVGLEDRSGWVVVTDVGEKNGRPRARALKAGDKSSRGKRATNRDRSGLAGPADEF